MGAQSWGTWKRYIHSGTNILYIIYIMWLKKHGMHIVSGFSNEKWSINTDSLVWGQIFDEDVKKALQSVPKPICRELDKSLICIIGYWHLLSGIASLSNISIEFWNKIIFEKYIRQVKSQGHDIPVYQILWFNRIACSRNSMLRSRKSNLRK